MTAINVNELVLMDKDSIPKELKQKLAPELATIKSANELLDLPVMGKVFQFSGAKFADSVAKLMKHLESDKTITIGGLADGRGFIEAVDLSTGDATLTGTSTSLRFPATDWPEADTYAGVTAVIGQMYAGKTHHVRENAGCEIVLRYGEPLEDIDDEVIVEDQNDRRLIVIPVTNFVEMLEYALLLSFVGYRVAIDSFRKLVFSLTGAALSGGIIPAIFDVMTNVNNMFAAIGRHALITLNPMLKDDTDLRRYFELMAASVGGAVLLQDKRITGWTYRTARGRVNSRPDDFELESVDSSSLTNRSEFNGPRPGVNVQKLVDESPLDGMDARLGEPAASSDADDVADSPSRRGANFQL